MNSLKRTFYMFCFGISFGITAQEPESSSGMITDRPDATESPNTLPIKTIQVETGFFYEAFEGQELKMETYGYNTTLVRYGILPNLETRLGWNFEEVRTSINGRELNDVLSGLSPLLLGMKVAITKENGLLPDIGLLGHLYLPFTASTDFRPEYTAVDFRFAFGHTLSDKSSLSYNLGAQWGDDSPEAAYVYTMAYGYNITNSLSAYAEVYGDLPEDSSANHYWDAGLTYSIKNNIQLDATLGQSFTKAQDLLLSTGVSFRLPK